MSGYVFAASGDSCEICAALDGTDCETKPHENCQCQIIANDDNDDCEHENHGEDNSRYGSGLYDTMFGGELIVTCADGSTLGMSYEIDLGGFNPEGHDEDFDIFDYMDELMADEVKELCDSCPPPPLVS